MWQVLGSVVDFIHALLMCLWVLGMPLLFWHRRPELTRIYALFSLVFVLVSQVSRLAVGECVFTTLARWLWNHQTGSARVRASPDEWFTVRLSRIIFDMAPSHRAIAVTSELLSVLVAIGLLFSMHGLRGSPLRRLVDAEISPARKTCTSAAARRRAAS